MKIGTKVQVRNTETTRAWCLANRTGDVVAPPPGREEEEGVVLVRLNELKTPHPSLPPLTVRIESEHLEILK